MPMCHLILSPGTFLTIQAKGGSQKGLHYTVPEEAKSQSLCVPAHMCASSCLAGFYPQLAPTCLPRLEPSSPRQDQNAQNRPSPHA